MQNNRETKSVSRAVIKTRLFYFLSNRLSLSQLQY